VRCSMRKILFLVSAAVAVLFFPRMSYACSCSEKSLAEEVRDSAAIFTGTVVKLEVVDVKDDISTIVATIDVDKRFTGDVPKRLTLTTSNGCCYCAFGYDIATKYLFFAYSSESQLGISTCSRTKELASAKEELKFLERRNAPPD
jgi:hypothetical protein